VDAARASDCQYLLGELAWEISNKDRTKYTIDWGKGGEAGTSSTDIRTIDDPGNGREISQDCDCEKWKETAFSSDLKWIEICVCWMTNDSEHISDSECMSDTP
jgi:hypothetical protein